ncbi:MocR-like pyridoxine biosynthesis transcription factor PdxR [Streptomyces boluensis]|uniref:Aminotransferase class I/II-fold pyridoxal phosphate-dependent enzyme n=1 Tax=Streptomyces boluensis TaxID=1775135 RepID=A0A964XPG8_9ACTN|nr:PLP-dependent aminotransferase family protein [Streptomyces boluensis]NBE54757.1 aminotransferase class I/II-fold pyridoxal phosphate-dependent enzyme [Streptomyces boluensis]
MAETWATSPAAEGHGIDLHIDLRVCVGGSGVRKGLTDALREAVRGGRLAPGTRLPSSRALAVDLGIARNTVADAYADLVAEGWLTARQGSGTRVAERPVSRPATAPPRRTPGPARHDLTPGSPDLASFPREAWLRSARRALAVAPNEAFGYGDPRGRVELRTALADYLARARGVYADPDRIVVCAGVAHGLMLLGKVLGQGGARSVAVESYGLDVHRDLLTAAGLTLPPLPCDARGTRTDALARLWPGAVLLTPAHQFPLGMPLSPERRAETVDWARSSGGLILEDDYDGEFRYDRQPVGALQGLDPDRVVHLGTVSKSLAPALRLGWMVLPAALAGRVADAKGASDWACGVVDQLTFADFLTSGAYDRHVRAARLRYRRRRDQLVAALAARVPRVRVSGIAAGLHAVLELPAGTEQSTIRAAAWHGLNVLGLSRFRHPDVPGEGRDALVIGYGTPPDHAWSGALDTLCDALAGVSGVS